MAAPKESIACDAAEVSLVGSPGPVSSIFPFTIPQQFEAAFSPVNPVMAVPAVG
jgi:hypothetical protein